MNERACVLQESRYKGTIPYSQAVVKALSEHTPPPSWWEEKAKLAFGKSRDSCDLKALETLMFDRWGKCSGLTRAWNAGEMALFVAITTVWLDMQVLTAVCHRLQVAHLQFACCSKPRHATCKK
jgi:hypothetical protein